MIGIITPVPSIQTLKRRFRSPSFFRDLEIRETVARGLEFQTRLLETKARIAPPGFAWYPHDSFGTLSLLDPLLTGRARFLRSLTGDEPLVDVGCGDGALAFFFESLGHKVYAIDHPPTNYNGMEGVRALKAALGSAVRIEAADLDSQFRLPVRRCGLALFFGILYHLKNPFGALEALAGAARHCLLSTAIARFSPDGSVRLDGAPLAYLAGRDGLKGDETNYWIFSEAGLRTLVDRAGWDVLDWMVTGDPEATLWGRQPDLRVFSLLRSRAFPAMPRTQLLHGWHKLENDAWRWAARRFSIAVEETGTMTLRLTVPDVLPSPLTLTASCGGATVRRQLERGDSEFEMEVRPGMAEFELDKALPPGPEDGRERGIVVRGVEIVR
jgi:tRNA (mo5U34)-methyltransferase